jgi:hypothetical protein
VSCGLLMNLLHMVTFDSNVCFDKIGWVFVNALHSKQDEEMFVLSISNITRI